MAIIDRRGASVSAADPPAATTPNPDLAIKTAVRVATTGANIALSGLITLDGIALAAGDRVLVKDQTDATANGIYSAQSGNWQRTVDANNNSQWASGCLVLVVAGTSNAGRLFELTTADPITLGTSHLTYTPFGSTIPNVFYAGDYATFDGVTDDTAGLQALGAAVTAARNAVVIFPPGRTAVTYSGAQALDALFNFNTGAVKYVRVEGNGATIQVAHSFLTSEVLLLFNLAEATNLLVDGLDVVQTHAVSFAGGVPYGTVVVSGSNSSGDPTLNNFNISLTNCTLTGGMALLEMSNSNSLWMEDCHAISCFYGVLGLTGVQGFSVRNFFSRGCDRDIFLKGVTDFDIDVIAINPNANSVLLSAEANNQVLSGGRIGYRVLARTDGSRPASYITIGPTTALTGCVFRDIDIDLDIDLSGDSQTVPVVKFIKNTASNLGTVFQNIRFSGNVSGALNSAGNLIDLFTSADIPWNGESANGITFEDFEVTGSATPTFYVDYSPFPTLVAGGFRLVNFDFPGNYTDSSASNVNTQRYAANAHFANLNAVLGASWGGTGLYQPTAHGVLIAEGSAPMALAAIGTAGRLLIDKGAGADPAFTAMSGDATISGAGALTVSKVNGVAFPAGPSTNTVPVVTGGNAITYEAVPNAALANSSITLNAGTGVGLTAPGAMSLGSTYTFGATTDTVQFAKLGLGQAAPSTGILGVTGTVTDTNQASVMSLAPSLTFTSGSAVTQFGMLDSAITTVSGGSNLTSITAFYQNQLNIQSSATLALGIGFRARLTFFGASPTGTISASAAAEIAAPTTSGITGTPSLTISAHRGLYVRNQGISLAGVTATASYAIDIDAQSGSSANYALRYNSASPTYIQSDGGVSVGTSTGLGAGTGNFTGMVGLGSFTVGTLPAGSAAGQTAYASNCRVFNGAGTQEGAGVGTGGLVSYNGTAWKIAGTNVTAVA